MNKIKELAKKLNETIYIHKDEFYSEKYKPWELNFLGIKGGKKRFCSLKIIANHLRYFPSTDRMVSNYEGEFTDNYEDETMDEFNAHGIQYIIDIIDEGYVNKSYVYDALDVMEELAWINKKCNKNFPSREDLETLMQTGVRESQESEQIGANPSEPFPVNFVKNKEEVFDFLKKLVSEDSLAKIDHMRF